MRIKKFNQINEADIKDTLPEDYIRDVRRRAAPHMGGPSRQDIREAMELMDEIFKTQEGNEDKLTKIGIDILMEFYGRILEDVELDVKIVSPDDEEKAEMVDKMQDNEEESDEEESEEIEIPFEVDKDEIDRRKIINNIMQGEAQNVHSMIYSAKDEIDKIDPSLIDLYIRHLEINKKFDWDENRPDMGDIMKQHPEMANCMETDYPKEGEEDGKVKIKARVLDLPMLIHETVKGIYELMSAKAIPNDPVMAQKLLQLTDTPKDEQEDIKYGPYIAADIRDYINDLLKRTTDEVTQQIPNLREFIFSKMMELSPNIFVKLIKDILMKNYKDADEVLRSDERDEDLVYQSILDAVGEKEEYVEFDEDEETLTGEREGERKLGTEGIEDEMLKPKERTYADLSKTEINDLINKALDEGDFETVKKLTPYL